VVGTVTVLEKAVVCLPFGAMSTARIFKEDGGKGRDFLGSMKSLKALKKLKREFKFKMNSQVN